MAMVIGVDEAGYGPNLGPLVVAATAWQVACDEPASADLYALLRDAVAPRPIAGRVPIADSKQLYASGQGLRELERGVHAVLGAMGLSPATWRELVAYLEADPTNDHARTCWPTAHNARLPTDVKQEEVGELAARLATVGQQVGVVPLAVCARLVFPGEFNDLVTEYGTKGAALSHISVGLLRKVIDTLSTRTPRSSLLAPTYAICDKHGGRNCYAAILQHHFPEHWIEPQRETRAESRYEWGLPAGRTCVCFRAKGEAFLPTAIASMTAKYLRELAMEAFNTFWKAHLPHLRPTAGYPLDARRFRAEIESTRRKLNIDLHALWRDR
ncbi:MAG: hypothetical protein IT425_08925 [Pirellulales bacterium]|nr:hypothetical protein [Pirellulales bacterium]